MADTDRSKTSNKHPKTSPVTNRFLRWSDGVAPLVGISRSHAHQLISEGKFPAPIKLVEGGRASAWLESEIQGWIEQRIEASRPTSPETV